MWTGGRIDAHFGVSQHLLLFRRAAVIMRCRVHSGRAAGGQPARRGGVSMVTLNDIAARLGISKSTVSKGLNNASDVSEELRRKILETAAEMGYTGRRTAKKLCIIIQSENMGCEEPNQFGFDLIAGFQEIARPEGWTVDVVPVTMEYQRTVTYEETMVQGGWLGAFVLAFSLIDPWMEEFKTVQIPTVLYDNQIKENPSMVSVECDSGGGLLAAVRHLCALGHRRIALLSGTLDSFVLRERYSAYRSAMEACGLPVDEELIGLGYYLAESTRKFLPKFIEKGATAILCSDDARAMAAYTECMDRSLRIPQDMSIVGFDDLPIAAYMNPPLTTIRQDRLALGKCGYFTLSCLLNDVAIESIHLRAPLIVRGSTGPVPVREALQSGQAVQSGQALQPGSTEKEGI